MNAQEALKLLSRWALDDRREVNAVIALNWADRFHTTPAYLVEQAADRISETGGYISPATVKQQLAILRPRIEADIRSARARGLIDDRWPSNRPLDQDIARRLTELRATEWEDTNDRPEAIAPVHPAIARRLGQIGRKP